MTPAVAEDEASVPSRKGPTPRHVTPCIAGMIFMMRFGDYGTTPPLID
jgi:hypothetical protein